MWQRDAPPDISRVFRENTDRCLRRPAVRDDEDALLRRAPLAGAGGGARSRRCSERAHTAFASARAQALLLALLLYYPATEEMRQLAFNGWTLTVGLVIAIGLLLLAKAAGGGVRWALQRAAFAVRVPRAHAVAHARS
jgi:hypothetical protein